MAVWTTVYKLHLWRSPFAARLGISRDAGPTHVPSSNGDAAELSRNTSLRNYGGIKGQEQPDVADPQLWSPVRDQ